jgi:malic enzyme
MNASKLTAPWPRQSEPVYIAKTGIDLVRDPLLNKGTAFTAEERERFHLDGLLPSRQISMEMQVRRVLESLGKLSSPFDKFLELSAMQDRNEHLYYRVLSDRLEELMPIIYTPTVAEATRNFSKVFRRGRGVWLTPGTRGRMARVLRNAAGMKPIRLIVATDNEAILGIGDQGAGGMAICVGKLSLYTVAAGIPPYAALPISLDVGTDNPALLENDFYVGWREPRLRGAEYDEFIDEFVDAIAEVFPAALLQWEDLRKDNALRVLDRHRSRLASFNDDIQGTGAVALAGMISAGRITGQRMSEQRVVVYGAGAAGLGIARQISAAMRLAGLDDAQVRSQVAAMDSRGLLVADQDIADHYKKELAWPTELAERFGLGGAADRGLASVIRAFRPTVLIGTSGNPGSFTEPMIREMATHCERPVILPFSNPSELSEAVPADLLAWTDGRALVATGSPFDPVDWQGRRMHIGQGNNVLIFPGVGLGALLGGLREITDDMLTAAAFSMAHRVTEEELSSGMLFPAVSRLRDVSAIVAAAVINCASGAKVTDLPDDGLINQVRDSMWVPRYEVYRHADIDVGYP